MALHDRETWLPDANTQELQIETYTRHPIWKKKSLVVERRSCKKDSFMARVISQELLWHDN